MRTRGPVAPLLVGVVGAAVLLTGTLRAVDLRREEHAAERAQARAAAAARAEKAYLDGLRPVLESVFDQAQPLLDVFDAFDEPHEYDLAVRDDVLGRGGARTVLLARQAELRNGDVPPRYATLARRLDKALLDFAQAAELLADASDPDAPVDSEGDVRGFGDGQAVLATAVNGWSTTTSQLFLDGSRPSVPGFGREGALPGRSPRSKGAYLYAADRVCGGADTASAGLPDPQDAASFLRLAPKQVALARSAVERLRAVPAPAPDAAALGKSVLAPLGAFTQSLATTDRVLKRLREGTTGLSGTEGRELLRVESDARAVAKGYDAYGATVCTDFFDPGPASPTGDAPDDIVSA